MLFLQFIMFFSFLLSPTTDLDYIPHTYNLVTPNFSQFLNINHPFLFSAFS